MSRDTVRGDPVLPYIEGAIDLMLRLGRAASASRKAYGNGSSNRHGDVKQTIHPQIQTGWAIVALALLLGSTPGFGQSFDPVRRNLEWSADRNIIDIEVVGSTSLLPERHILQEDRRLRLRLERAYVSTFFRQSEPGFEILNLAVDMPTELPSALLLADRRPIGRRTSN